MKNTFLYCILFLWLVFCGCVSNHRRTDWHVSLDKSDKKPYGSYLAYKTLPYLFPKAKVIDLSRRFRYTSIDPDMQATGQGRSLFIALGLDFYLSEAELDRLVSFAREGNEVLIFARVIDDRLEKLLGCEIQHNGYEEVALSPNYNGTASLNALSLKPEGQTYGYQGRSVLAYIGSEDTTQGAGKNSGSSTEEADLSPFAMDTLGMVKGRPDFVRVAVGQGHIMLHSAPLAMSNYFLLQRNNVDYLRGLARMLPQDISRIYWNDYYKRSTELSDLGILLKYPATRWALIFALLGLLVYVLFESKRKQRVIPEIVAPENSSVSFVQTIGRLYYNKGDHNNLAEKMVQHFLEWIRTHYFISTNQYDEQFARQLVAKSGLPESVVRSVIDLIREVQIERKPMDETDLYHLHQTIQQFYKNDNK